LSWETSTIGEVLEVLKNGVSCVQGKEAVGDKITRIETISQQVIDFNRVGYSTLSKADKDKSRLEVGDILFSHINSPIHVGKTAIYQGGEELFHGINLLLIRTKKDVNPNFFNYFLKNLFYSGYWVRNCKQAVNQASVNQQDIKRIHFSYPPLSKQLSIVDNLNSAFYEIDNAIEATTQNIKNASNLLVNFITRKINEAAENFPTIKLGEACNGVEYGTSAKSLSEGKVPVIRMGNLSNGAIDFTDLVYTNDLEDIAKYSLKAGDVLFNRTNSPIHVGKTAIFNGGLEAIFAGYLIRVNYKKELINPEYLNLYLNSERIRKHGFSVMSHSINQANINGSKLKEYPFVMPSMEVQSEIAFSVAALKAEVDKLIATYEAKVANLNILKTSILTKAFANTPQKA
jgi:type I restriction enzyme S subunit